MTGTGVDSELIRPNIRRLEPYHCARESIQEGILLDANENPFPRLRQGIALNRYPDPHQVELRRALAGRLGVESDMVLAGSGSDEVLDWIYKVFDLTGGVAVAEPTYGMYRVMADIYGVSVFEFQLSPDFDFDAGAFLRAVPAEVRLIFLCSPNNPTGNLLSRGEIVRLLSDWKGVVVLDEAYVEFSAAESMVLSVEEHPNLVVLRTFSKAFGRAGFRLGYTVAHPEVIRFFLKVKSPYNLNSLVQQEGIDALGAEDGTNRQIAEIVAERERLRRGLERLPGVGPVFRSDANFVLFRCPKAREVCRALLREGIIVRDRSGMKGLNDCIRVSVGTRAENDAFLERLRFLAGRN